MKKENQDEYFLQVGNFGGQAAASCYCIFDGHGSYGHKAAAFVLRELPVLLDEQLKAHFQGANVSPRDSRGKRTCMAAMYSACRMHGLMNDVCQQACAAHPDGEG
jgi:serine/threonine protein phosphatase PrpC